MALLAFLLSYIWYVLLSSLFRCGMFHFCYDSLLARLVIVASLCMAFVFSVGDGGVPSRCTTQRVSALDMA
jgi:hypothetical protein